MRARPNRQQYYADLGYTPRLAQGLVDEALDAGKQYVSFYALPRGGKSYHAAKVVGAQLLVPNTHCWIVAPTYPLGSKEFIYILQDHAKLGWLRRATTVRQDVRGGNMAIHYPWGSFVEVASADNPTSLRAEELDYIILAEASALNPDIFERHLMARVEKRRGKVLIPTTPKGYNWIYDKFYLPSLTHLNFEYGPWVGRRRERIGGTPNPLYDPSYWAIVVSAVPEYGDVLEDGIYPPEAIERARRLMAPEIFAEQFGGTFSSYAGLVYKDFNPALHECEPFPVPDTWVTVVGYDHGASAHDPTAILFGSYAPEGNPQGWPAGTLVWWDEYYGYGKSAAEYASIIRRTLGFKRPAAIVIDSSARQVRHELLKVGVFTTIPHDKQIEARITRVTSLLRERKFRIMRGRCPNLRDEIVKWEWDEERSREPRKDQKDHALDAMGYAALAPVALPGAEGADPDALPLEPVTFSPLDSDLDKRRKAGAQQALQRAWKPVRRWQRQHAEAEQRQWVEALDQSPFEETSLVVSDYRWD